MECMKGCNFISVPVSVWLLLASVQAQVQPPRTERTPILLKQETFRLPLKAAQALLIAGKKDPDLHATLLRMVQEKSATLENLMLVRAAGDVPATLELIQEFPYPTDFYTSDISQTLTLIDPRGLAPEAVAAPPAPLVPDAKSQPVPPSNGGFGIMTHIIPTAYSFRNLGDTLQVIAAVAKDGDHIALTTWIRICQLSRRNALQLR
jgi:hypothetical protein